MSVFVYAFDALEKMAAVELLTEFGPSLLEQWLERQRTDAAGPCTFLVFRNEWETTWRPRIDSWSREDLKRGVVRDPRHGDVAIYGVGGWHRYSVEGDGELVFLALFATSTAVAAAEAAGFRVV